MSVAEIKSVASPTVLVAKFDSGAPVREALNNKTIGLEQDNPLSAVSAANIAFNSELILQGWSRVHSPLPSRKRGNTRALLAAYDGIGSDSPVTNHMLPEAQSIAAALDVKKTEIVEASAEWDEVQARHAVLRAIKDVSQAGRFYLDLLYERTGLTQESVRQLRETIPSWRETEKVLTPEQRVTAEAVCARLLIRKCHEAASSWVNSQGQPSNKELISKETAKLLKAHIRVQQQQEGTTPQEAWADLQAREMLRDLEKGRNKIFDRAQLWNGREKQLKIRAVAKEFDKVDNDTVLEELTGITPDMVAEARKGRIKEWIKTGVLAVGNESLSHLPGFAAIVPAAQVQEQLAQNPWVLAVGTAVIYGGMAGAIVRNSFLSADLIAETGVGLDPAGKAKFESAIDNEKMEAVKASLKYHGAWELPFYGLAAVIGARYGWEAGLAYFNVASISGVIKNTAVNAVLETRQVIKTALDKRRKGRQITVDK